MVGNADATSEHVYVPSANVNKADGLIGAAPPGHNTQPIDDMRTVVRGAW